MTHIIDFRDREDWPEKEIEFLESIGAVEICTKNGRGEESGAMIRYPMFWRAFLINIEASMADLMRPPYCPWCKELMKKTMISKLEIDYTCKACGGKEVTRRYPPEE